MKRAYWVGALLTALLMGGLVYLRYGAQEPGAPEPAPSQAPAEPEPQTDLPAIRHPVPPPSVAAEAAAPPLPPLDESDAPFRGALREAFGARAVDSLLVPEQLIERVVVMIDSLDREAIPLRLHPLAPAPGQLEVERDGDALRLAPSNAQRYAAYRSALEAADASGVARLYLRYYPLFQEAYERLGYADRHFNDRLVAIIDHLLATPEVESTPQLVRPQVAYEFADRELEERSSGQKALIRIGPENARLVKAKLREIRQVIASDAL